MDANSINSKGNQLRAHLPSQDIVKSYRRGSTFSDKLLQAISHERIVPHFHIPVQSGSDRILRLMRRPYSVSRYLNIIERIRKLKPDSHLAADIIVGFPTESPEDFQATLEAMGAAEFTSVHVFKYRLRKGTQSAPMRDDVLYCEKVKRSRRAMADAAELNFKFRSRYAGAAALQHPETYGNKLLLLPNLV